MKKSLLSAVLVLATVIGLPAHAQEWDLQPNAQPQAPSLAVQVAAQPQSDFDLSDLQPQQVPTTGTQTPENLPVCRTAVLARISGPVMKNGLPPCNLDSFVTASGNNPNIYNVGTFDLHQTNWSPINEGIKGGTAEGLTTGVQYNTPSVYAN
ncbi:MAG TPA: hypothetical protein V6C97_23785 [Oculatellaceae cyanobacterium]